MAITYATTVAPAALDAIVDLIDGGSGDSTGDFVVKSSGGTVLATMTFSSTAFGSASSVSAGNATVSSNTITDSGTPTAGTITNGAFRNKANTEIVAFSMGTSSADMIIADAVITSAYTAVGCSGITITLALT